MIKDRKQLEQAAMAKQELQRRQSIKRKASIPRLEIREPISLEFVTNLYLRLIEQSFRAKDLTSARIAIEALERLHFGKGI